MASTAGALETGSSLTLRLVWRRLVRPGVGSWSAVDTERGTSGLERQEQLHLVPVRLAGLDEPEPGVEGAGVALPQVVAGAERRRARQRPHVLDEPPQRGRAVPLPLVLGRDHEAQQVVLPRPRVVVPQHEEAHGRLPRVDGERLAGGDGAGVRERLTVRGDPGAPGRAARAARPPARFVLGRDGPQADAAGSADAQARRAWPR